MRRTAKVAALLGLAVTTACGSKTPAPPNRSARANPALAALGLTAADVPGTWTSAPHNYAVDHDEEAVERAAAGCAKAPDPILQRAVVLESDTFGLGALSADTTVTRQRSAATVTGDRAIVTTPTGQECLRKALTSLVDKGIPGQKVLSYDAHVTTDGLPAVPGLYGLVTSLLTTQVKTTQRQVVEYAYRLAAGDVTVELHFFGIDADVPADVRTTALTAVTTRLAAYRP